MLARKKLVQNTRIFKQAASLERAGYDVTVIGVLGPDTAGRESADGYTILRLPTDPAYLASLQRLLERWCSGQASSIVSRRARSMLRRASFPFRWLEYYRRAYRLVTRELGRPDVIHCNDLDTLPVGLLLARRLEVPVLYDVQDLYSEQDHIPSWYRKVLVLQERVLIRHVQRITAVNDAIADVLARTYRVEIDTVVLNCPPFYDGPSEGSSLATVRDALRIPADRTILVYSGGLEPNRGLENVVLSLCYLGEDVSLVLLGEGTLRTQLERVAAGARLGERVLFHDFVPHVDVPAFISSADIGIVPYERVGLNHYLCSPSKLFHYIMAELPVVCSDFPFLRKVVIGNGIGSTFDPGDAASIASAIREVIGLRVAANGLHERVRTLKRRYCWEEEEKRLLAVYTSLTPGARSTTAALSSTPSIGSHGAYSSFGIL